MRVGGGGLHLLIDGLRQRESVPKTITIVTFVTNSYC